MYMESYVWYEMLEKPFFAPPSWVFSPVWAVLYVLIFLSFGYTLFKCYKKRFPQVLVLPLALNVFFNLLFSPIQFGLQNNVLALLDIILVLITIIWFMYLVKKESTLIFYAQIPYLLWVSFATILQISITLMNL
jgi:benzodiazapine receptor